MKSQLAVIYIPGLGDSLDGGRRTALLVWRIFGVKAELVPMRWSSNETYQTKYDRVLLAVVKAKQRAHDVSLVADSAGATIALAVFAADPSLHKVVTICGVNSSLLPLGSDIKQKNPALSTALDHLKSSAPKLNVKRVISFISRDDHTVRHRYSHLPGAETRVLPIAGHILAVSFAMTFGCKMIIGSLRK